MATDAISQEQAREEFLAAEDKAIMAGADMEDINSIRARAGEPTGVVIETSFMPEEQDFLPSAEETVSRPWSNEAALEYAQKLQAAAGLSDEEKTQIYKNLMLDGQSKLADEITQALEHENKIDRIAATASVVEEIGPDVAAQRVQDILTTEDPDAVDSAALASVLANSNLPEETLLERWEKEEQIRKQFKREFAERVTNVSVQGDEVVHGIVSMFPFVEQATVMKLVDRLKEKFDAPLSSSASAFLLEGSLLTEAKEWIAEQDPATQLDILEAILDASQEGETVFTANEYINRSVLTKLFSGATGDYLAGELDTDKYIDNAVSLLDATIVGSVVGKAWKAASSVREASSLRSIQRLDETQGANVTAAAVVDETGTTAQALGTLREDVVVDALLPKWQGYASDPLVSEEFIERQIKLLREIQDRKSDIKLHLSEEEKLLQKEKIEAALTRTKPLGAKLNVSEIHRTEDGVRVRAVYDYDNLEQAKTSLLRMHPEAKVEEQFGQLVVTIDDKYRLGSHTFFNMEDIYGRGSKAAYFGDISTNLATNLSNSFYVAFDRSRGHEKLFLDMIKPFSKASNRNKGHVVSILDRLRAMEEEASIQNIRDMLPTGISAKDAQEIIEGVISVRTMTDAAYVVENNVFRARQLEKGRRYITNGDDFAALATPISKEMSRDIKVAYDPNTGQITKLTQQDIDDLYLQGKQIAVSGDTFGPDRAVQTTNIIVDGATEIKELPQQLLKYDANYLTTLYKDQYFVTARQKEMVLNGSKLSKEAIPEKVLVTAKSKKEALRAVARLKEEFPDLEVAYKNARELTAAETTQAFESLRRNTGGLFFSKKGERLKDTVGNLAEIEDPVNAIKMQASAVSRLVELRPVIDLMKERFVNTFPEVSTNGFPTSKGQIVSNRLVRDDRVQAAKVMWDYINMVENGSVAGQKWQNIMVSFGEWVEDVTGSERLGSVLRTKVGQKDPLSALRGATFLATIVLNPARQLVIQSQQALFLAGVDPKFVLSGQMSRQGTSLLLSTVGDTTASPKALAKLAGMDVDEFKQASKAFRESGLVESIDSHLLGRDAMLSIQEEITKSKAAALGQAGKNVLTKTLGAVKGAGFDLGERINISQTYMLAWKRFKKNNPNVDITTEETKFKIAADARQLALGMTKAGAFGYQEGILSAATQFFSIQHKAFLAMLRGVPGLGHYGNKAITPQEARRIMLFQTGIYGGAGMGINALIDDGLDAAGVTELTPEQRQFLHGGVMDLVTNALLQAATDEDVDISFAANMSAGQGFAPSLLQYIEDIASGDTTVLELIAGPSANLLSRFGTAATTMKYVLSNPRELDEKRARLLFDDFASIASGYKNVLTADAVLRLGQWVDKNKNLLPMSAEPTEAVVYGLLGMPPRELEAVYKTFTSQKESRERIDAIAKTAYERITRIVGQSSSQEMLGPASLQKMMELIEKESHFLAATLGQDTADYYAVKGRLSELIKKRSDVGDGDLISNLHKAVIKNTYGGDLPEMVRYMQRYFDLSEEDAQTILTVFEKGLGGEKR